MALDSPDGGIFFIRYEELNPLTADEIAFQRDYQAWLDSERPDEPSLDGPFGGRKSVEVSVIADAFVNKDGILTEAVEKNVPGGGLITAIVHAAAGNTDHAEVAAVQGAASAVKVGAAVAAGAVTGGAGTVIAAGIIGGAAAVASEELILEAGRQGLADNEGADQLGEFDPTTVAIRIGVGALTGGAGAAMGVRGKTAEEIAAAQAARRTGAAVAGEVGKKVTIGTVAGTTIDLAETAGALDDLGIDKDAAGALTGGTTNASGPTGAPPDDAPPAEPVYSDESEQAGDLIPVQPTYPGGGGPSGSSPAEPVYPDESEQAGDLTPVQPTYPGGGGPSGATETADVAPTEATGDVIPGFEKATDVAESESTTGDISAEELEDQARPSQEDDDRAKPGEDTEYQTADMVETKDGLVSRFDLDTDSEDAIPDYGGGDDDLAGVTDGAGDLGITIDDGDGDADTEGGFDHSEDTISGSGPAPDGAVPGFGAGEDYSPDDDLGSDDGASNDSEMGF